MMPPRSAMGVAWTCFSVRKFSGPLALIEHVHRMGGSGVQAPVRGDAPAAVRALCEKYGMYLEGVAPVDGTGSTRALFRAAREAGARCVRAACLSGRRYENFSSLDEWKRWEKEAHARLESCVKIAETEKIPLALENHKDWTAAELAALMKKYSTPFLGVCLDTGNNVSFLEDPMEVVRTLAPFAISTHVKDLDFDQTAEGFLMAEVPFGAGALNLIEMARLIRASKPGTAMTLEMITRNPLLIPCLTQKYWATMPGRPGSDLAAAMDLVRKRARKLPRIDGMAPSARADWEAENIQACLHWARESGLAV